MTYRLRVTARAVADADEAYAWIAEHLSPAQAERWYQGLFKQMETLTRQPVTLPACRRERQVSRRTPRAALRQAEKQTPHHLYYPQ